MAVIKDVAREAGVSATTVSRYLNGGKYVKAEIQERIRAAIERLDYKPSHIARSLVSQRSHMIGVIVPDIRSGYHGTLLSHIEGTANLNGYSILMCNIAEDAHKELAYIDFLLNMPVDGVVILHEELTDETAALLGGTRTPIVFAGVRPTRGQYISVAIDDCRAAYDGTASLLDAGHRSVAFLGGHLKDHSSGQQRLKGFREAHRDRGVPFQEALILHGGYSYAVGYGLAQQLLSLQGPRPTAVFCMSDEAAVGCLNALTDQGVSVPGEISVLGFDGLSVTEQVRPRLSTLCQPLGEIGSMSVELLIDAIEKRQRFPNIFELVLPHRLEIRESVREW